MGGFVSFAGTLRSWGCARFSCLLLRACGRTLHPRLVRTTHPPVRESSPAPATSLPLYQSLSRFTRLPLFPPPLPLPPPPRLTPSRPLLRSFYLSPSPPRRLTRSSSDFSRYFLGIHCAPSVAPSWPPTGMSLSRGGCEVLTQRFLARTLVERTPSLVVQPETGLIERMLQRRPSCLYLCSYIGSRIG